MLSSPFTPTNAHCTYSYMLSSDAHKMHVSVHLSLTNCVYRFMFRSQIACICSSVAHKLRVYVPVAHKLFVSVHLLPTNCVHLFIYRSRNVQSVAHKLCVSVYLSLTNACLCAEASVTVTSVLGMLTSLPCNITPSLQDDRYSSSVFTKHRLCLFR